MSERVVELVGLRQVSADVVYPHVFGNADREVGGVLVGRAAREGGPPLITGAIPALQADERRATLTFTQDAWEHVHRTLDAEFPADEQIVGWYHSHPGFGIFLSEHDLFIHRNFFGGPSQIALVVDPHARTEGIFAWHGEDVALLFERATPEGWQAPVVAPGGAGAVAPPAPALPSRTAYPLLALAIAGVLGLGVGFGLERALVDGGGNAGVRTVTQQGVLPSPGTSGRPAPAPAGAATQGSMTVRGAAPYAESERELGKAQP